MDATVTLGLGKHDDTFDLRLFPASLSDSNHEGGNNEALREKNSPRASF